MTTSLLMTWKLCFIWFEYFMWRLREKSGRVNTWLYSVPGSDDG